MNTTPTTAEYDPATTRRFIEATEREGAALARFNELRAARIAAEVEYRKTNAHPEPSPEVLELAAVRGATDAFVALATARSKEVALTPDSDGAEILWDHAPTPPYAPGSREEDAYMDSWYETAHAGLTLGEAVLRYSFKSGRMTNQ